MSQVETERISLADIVAHDDFATGYLSGGGAFGCDGNWFYERGRVTAALARARLGRLPRLWIDNGDGQRLNPEVLDWAGRAVL